VRFEAEEDIDETMYTTLTRRKGSGEGENIKIF
jgi:hypothetical protein